MNDHQFINASAGTGKTFQLKEEVLKLVLNGTPIEKILVVTFTEKATKELISRLREALYEKKEEPLVKTALRDFPKMTVSTIHGFCQSILTSFALEGGLPFNPKIRTAGLWLQEQIFEVTRLNPQLIDIDDLMEGEFKKSKDVLKYFEDGLTQQWLRQDEFQSFEPTEEIIRKIKFPDGFVAELHELRKLIPSKHSELPAIFKQALDGRKCISALSRLNKACNPTNIIDWLDFLGETQTSGDDRKSNLNIINQWNHIYESNMLNGKKDWPENSPFTEAAQLISNFALKMEILLGMSLEQSYLKKALARLKLLKKSMSVLPLEIEKRRRSQGILTFDTMIQETHRILCQEENPLLVTKIRQRYTAALVDEFQDTDKLQWDIFKKIFLHNGQKLIAVGDPKQSIYGFRGADLNVYYQALKDIQTHATTPSGNLDLKVNYRSHPKVIKFFNKSFPNLFKKTIYNPSSELEYIPTEEQQEKEVWELSPLGEPEDSTGGIWVKFSDWAELNTSKQAALWFRWIVKKVLELRRHSFSSTKGKQKPIQWGDFLILVEKNHEAQALQKLLNQKKIPSVISGKGALFSSPEASETIRFLDALENYENPSKLKAFFCTRYFTPSKKLFEDHNFLARWQDQFRQLEKIAKNGSFLGAFQTLRKHPEIRKGFCSMLLRGQGERTYTNTLHILEIMQNHYLNGEFTWGNASAYLRKLSQNTKEQEDADLRLETSGQALRIMTIHGSKGLEAPIVFFAGGFSSASYQTGEIPVVTEKKGKRIVSFLVSKETRKIAERTEEDEKRRLYYVALTRAGSMIYLPDYELTSKYPSWGSWFKSLIQGDGPFLDAGPWSYKDYYQLPVWDEIPRNVPGDQSLLALTPSWDSGNRYPRSHSFSSLTKIHLNDDSMEMEILDENFTETQPIPEDENTSELPGGTAFGNFVHHILEITDFTLLYKAPLQSFYEIWKNQGAESLTLWRELAARNLPGDRLRWFDTEFPRYLISAINTPLQYENWIQGDTPGPELSLASIPKSSTVREHEFLLEFKKGENLWNMINDSIKYPDLKPGYIKGTIDLIFEHEDKWYILDWKTNHVHGDLRSVMLSHRYDLQAKIYAKALQEISRIDPQSKPFGGVIYYFLKPMKAVWFSGDQFQETTK